MHLDNVFCISQSQRLQCSASGQLSVQLLAIIMRPRSDRESDDDDSDNDVTREMSRLRRKGSHADLQLEWSVLNWEKGSQGEL